MSEENKNLRTKNFFLKKMKINIYEKKIFEEE